jgi:hypothetical protein
MAQLLAVELAATEAQEQTPIQHGQPQHQLVQAAITAAAAAARLVRRQAVQIPPALVALAAVDKAVAKQVPVTELLEQPIQVAAVAALTLMAVMVVLVAQALSLFVTNQQLKKARAAQSLLLAVITTTHLHLLALTQHKGKSHVTFCKSSRRHRYTSYRC